jgi:hypothetical protein
MVIEAANAIAHGLGEAQNLGSARR